MKAARAYLELIRLPLTPTAIADSIAGFFIARELLTQTESAVVDLNDVTTGLVPVCMVSVLLYSAGMVSNDLFDLKKDRERSPQKPLPAGAVSVTRAVALALGLILAALGVALVLGATLPALSIVVAILAYNAGGKHVPVLGNLLMGSCRSLNLLLGATAVSGVTFRDVLGSPPLLAAAGVLGLYIAGVTAISLLEDRPYRRGTLAMLAGILLAFPAFLVFQGRAHWIAWLNAAIFTLLLMRELRLPTDGTASAACPHPAEKVVRGGLRGIYFMDAGLVASLGLIGPALSLHGLFVFGWLCMRLWVKSGSSA